MTTENVRRLFDEILGQDEEKAAPPGRGLEATGIEIRDKDPVEKVFAPGFLERCIKVEKFDFSYDISHLKKTQIPEEYHTLRTNIQTLSKQTGKKSFVISSCHHGEGKSTTAVFLSKFLGLNRDKRVLLVDCDLRRPRLKKFLNLTIQYGLDDVIEKNIPLEEAIIYSQQDNLSVLPGRSGHSNAPELLEKPRTRALPRELEQYFDYIIYDTSPVLSTTDPAIIGAMVGALILVVKAGATQREAINHAQNLLKQAACPVDGIVLTQRR
jgi:capsular exopolysaccharide synthesis family protein